MKNNPLKNKKIFIAGHNGMVGSALVRYLKKKKYQKINFSKQKKTRSSQSAESKKFFNKRKSRYNN